METMNADPLPDQRLYLCTLILVFATGHIVIAMLRGVRGWRNLSLILLSLALLLLLLAWTQGR